MTPRSNHTPGLLRRRAITDWLSFVLAFMFGLVSLGVLAYLLDLGPAARGCTTSQLYACATNISAAHTLVALAPFAALGIGALLWRKPVLGVLVLFAGATLIEGNAAQFPDATTELIPFWRNLSSSGIAPLPFSPAELVIIMCLAVWLVRGLLTQALHIHSSTVLRSYSIYLLAVLSALVLGAATGGNIVVALWEVRVPVLAAFAMLLTLNLVRSRRHVEALGWLILVGSGLKGVQGTWRYVVTLNRTITYNNLLEHEEALFFPAFYLYLLLLFIFGGSRRQKRVGVLFLPFVLLADFANQRRASTAALVVALAALVCILLVALAEHRKRILGGMLVALVLLTGYTAVYWNSGSRLAQPIRAIKSQFMPNNRDESSDLYRELEDRGLMWQIRANPVLGRGYGVELPLLPGMWDARDVAPFILYMPHNSVLWLWWRTGIFGFALFWLAVGTAVVRNCQLVRDHTDPTIRRWALFAVTVTIIWSMLGFLDQGFLLYREVVYVWIVLAVPDVLRRLASARNASSQAIGGAGWSS
jgi:hypothetical protein